jgi:2-polyprenyl-6-hydroxyphenyl methylase/3-demethylubiquinone-9 3-methyltransferase
MINKNFRKPSETAVAAPALDNSSDERFFRYYASQSEAHPTWQRLRDLRDTLLRVVSARGRRDCLDVADVGCGAGTQSLVWAESGHRVRALDINEPLVSLARQRASMAGATIEFRVGSAAALPWPDQSADVCIALELLEHVPDWQSCLCEFVRILRPGGSLYLTTTNRLCPMQEEFNLPLYSWYPAPLKRHFERVALRRPSIVNHARYPAVNWFTVFQLKKILEGYGCECLDRFDLIDLSRKGRFARFVVAAVRTLPPLRWLGLCVGGTRVLAIKRPATP